MADEQVNDLKRALIFVPKAAGQPILDGEVKPIMWYWDSKPRYFTPYEMVLLQDGVAIHFMNHLGPWGLEYYNYDKHEELIEAWQSNHKMDKPKEEDIKKKFKGGESVSVQTWDCSICDSSYTEERKYRQHYMQEHKDKVVSAV